MRIWRNRQKMLLSYDHMETGTKSRKGKTDDSDSDGHFEANSGGPVRGHLCGGGKSDPGKPDRVCRPRTSINVH